MRIYDNCSLFFNGLRLIAVLTLLGLVGSEVVEFPANASGESKRKQGRANSLILASNSHQLPAESENGKLILQVIDNSFSEPILIDFSSTAGKLLIGSGQPNKLELFSTEGRHDFVSNNFLSRIGEPRSVTSVHDNASSFELGEVFLGFDDGLVVGISANRTKITNMKLPLEKSSVSGGLLVDKTGAFGGDLMAVTGEGRIWRIDINGNKNLFIDLHTPLKGLTIIPNDIERYGIFSGKMIVGAKDQRGVFAIDRYGESYFYTLGFSPQDIDLIEEGSNLFAICAESGELLSLDAAYFSNHIGDILIDSADANEISILKVRGTELESTPYDVNAKIDQVIFAACSTSRSSLCLRHVDLSN